MELPKPLSPAQLAQYDEDGFITLRGVFSEDELDQLSGPIDAHCAPLTPPTIHHAGAI